MSKSILFLVLLTGSLLFAGGSEKTATQPAEAKKEAEAPAAAGMVATVDERGPVKGVRLSPEMREALARMINTSSDGLREEVKEDGTVIVDLQGRFQSALVVSIDENGKMVSTCFSQAPEHSCRAERHVVEKAPEKP